ncbi:hypothetical protein SAPIO_CDS2653 [Scedosporium apiospermum]|uniref:C2H2-type domain-containing protein n=1 Tax=Pseudallescheria apiosperma TaxID=563466 RepID=A0A084GCY3_PSEDA|nr:uncharacterized protein SAPIO_CDS2653 [Scedosporium apiospermum]KEZ45195.1 hypothetical protein SAPIO_CDS2653 [Scedosporium apiospermum]
MYQDEASSYALSSGEDSTGEGGSQGYTVSEGGQSYYTQTGEGSSTDISKHKPSDGYCCLVPGCKAVPFKRNADLDRHYKNIHRPAESKETYHCDYAKCSRRSSPFHRRDHFRDHLRDYHKESIAKRGKPIQTNWSEGNSGRKEWWRCTRCLRRVMVATHGFECPDCKTSRVQPDEESSKK